MKNKTYEHKFKTVCIPSETDDVINFKKSSLAFLGEIWFAFILFIFSCFVKNKKYTINVVKRFETKMITARSLDPKTVATKERINENEQPDEIISARSASSFEQSPDEYISHTPTAPDGAPKISPKKQIGTRCADMQRHEDKFSQYFDKGILFVFFDMIFDTTIGRKSDGTVAFMHIFSAFDV